MTTKKAGDFQNRPVKPDVKITKKEEVREREGIKEKLTEETHPMPKCPGKPKLPGKKDKISLPEFEGMFQGKGKGILSHVEFGRDKKVDHKKVSELADFLTGERKDHGKFEGKEIGLHIKMKDFDWEAIKTKALELKSKVDVDGDGEITKEELAMAKEDLKKYVEETVIPGIEAKVAELQDKMDANDDGMINGDDLAVLKEELKKYMEEVVIPGIEAKVAEVKEKLDVTDDGLINSDDLDAFKEELKKYMEEVVIPGIEAKVAELQEKLDVTGDGEINRDDLTAYMEEVVIPGLEARLAELQEKLDANEDGEITAEDLKLLADVNQDGDINRADMEIVIGKIKAYLEDRPVAYEKRLNLTEIKTVVGNFDLNRNGKIDRERTELLAGFILGDHGVRDRMFEHREFFTNFTFAGLADLKEDGRVDFGKIFDRPGRAGRPDRKHKLPPGKTPEFPVPEHCGFEISNTDGINRTVMTMAV